MQITPMILANNFSSFIIVSSTISESKSREFPKIKTLVAPIENTTLRNGNESTGQIRAYPSITSKHEM